MINLLAYKCLILFNNFKKQLFIFCILSLLAIFFESFSVILLFQGTSIFFNTSSFVLENSFLYKISNFMDIDIVEKKYTIFLLIVLIYFIKTFFLTFFSWWRNKFNHQIRKNIGKRLFLKYMFESHKYHLSKNSSEFIRNITIDNMNFAFSTFQALYLITEVGILILLSAVLFYLQPAVTLFFCFTYLLFSIGWHIAFKKKLIKWGQDRQFYDGKMLQFLKEGFGGHKEIQILGVENYFIKKFKLNLFNSGRMNFISDFVLDLPRLWLEFLLVMSFCFTLMFLLIFKEFNFLAIAPLLAAYSAAGLRLIPSISRIIVAINIINFNEPVTKLFRQEFKDNINKNELKNESTKNLEFENTISLKNVSFSHLENLPEIIKNFNYEIKKKEIVGIVGLSGAGKSTLGNLLMGVITPTKGSILIDDVVLEKSNRRKWQDKIGYVPQTIFFTDDSIKKNIALGEELNEINNEKIKQLISYCKLSDFIETLHLKEDTNVGELGSRISEGQKQRIGLARALYKDPDILVLDEFTSSLDVETENEIMKIIENLKGKKTIFIISHRQNAIKYCNKVLDASEFNKNVN